MQTQKIPYQPKGKIVGLTGGIASGKSMVSSYLLDHGYAVLDFDKIVKKVRNRPEVQARLLEIFGTTDPKQLRDIVFNEKIPNAKKLLNQEVGFQALIEALNQSDILFSEGHKIVIWDAAMLIETGTYLSLHGVILITAPEDKRLERLKLRDNISQELAEKMIKSQASEEAKKSQVLHHPEHIIICNEDSSAHLLSQMKEVLEFLSKIKVKQ